MSDQHKCPQCGSTKEPAETSRNMPSLSFLAYVPFTRLTCQDCGLYAEDEIGYVVRDYWKTGKGYPALIGSKATEPAQRMRKEGKK